MSVERPDVAILGSGMAGLTAAWRLTDPDVRDRVGRVTVYQRGFRLGGKGASSRGVNGRIEEHGLHVWLGYYDNAFRLIRECYDQLDRTTRCPDAPIRTWLDAFAPAPAIGLDEASGTGWSTWSARFTTNDELPGQPLEATPVVTVVDMVRRSAGLLVDFYRSLPWAAGTRPEELLIASGVTAAAGLASVLGSELRRVVPWLPSLDPLVALADGVRSTLMPRVAQHEPSRRLWQLLDIVTVQIRGIMADDLVRRGFRAVDHLDYRDWIAAHGASQETLQSPLVRGLYNLAFSHQGGDPEVTRFPAGLGLFLSLKTFFDYKGSIFWKMQAGMGDVVIAPLYQALVERGVTFELFHRVDGLHLAAGGGAVEAVSLGRQVDLIPPRTHYQPLRDYGGLACFPGRVDLTQVVAGEEIHEHDLESFWCRWPDAGPVRLVRGRDFDQLVLAIPVGMLGHVAGELAAADDRWRIMVETMETVGTQAFQLWLRADEASLGWPLPGVTVTNYVHSYDTWASMPHLLEREDWPEEDRPRAVAYFCSSMAVDPVDDRSDPAQPDRARARARAEAIGYLEHDVAHYWPNAAARRPTDPVDGSVPPPGPADPRPGFRWDLLCGADQAGPAAFDSQYLRANVDPSDRYVQATPASAGVRLRPDRSGFDGLHLAGDWTDCGLNAGCIEAAVLSGIQAANSVLGLPRDARITGGYLL